VRRAAIAEKQRGEHRRHEGARLDGKPHELCSDRARVPIDRVAAGAHRWQPCLRRLVEQHEGESVDQRCHRVEDERVGVVEGDGVEEGQLRDRSNSTRRSQLKPDQVQSSEITSRDCKANTKLSQVKSGQGKPRHLHDPVGEHEADGEGREAPPQEHASVDTLARGGTQPEGAAEESEGVGGHDEQRDLPFMVGGRWGERGEGPGEGRVRDHDGIDGWRGDGMRGAVRCGW
jgi:hypothetical protein